MAQAIPETTKQWNVVGTSGFDSLKFSEQPVPELGDNDVLVRIKGASLNYRDLVIPHGKYPFPVTDNVIPGSDGAGIVLGTGKRVTRFKPGDEVLTILNQSHIGGSLNALSVRSGLGGSIDGTFREIGAFNEQGLVHKPNTLDFVEASTLSCSGLTAWNALYGISDKKLMVGQWLLTQGTGGVSLFALQLAKATGARVIATTSSSEKAEVLRRLGADFVINYRETPNWGERAKELTGGIGVDHVVEVVGPSSMAQSLASIKIDGVITIIGVVGGQTKEQPGFIENLAHLCTTRGILVGSRTQLEDLVRAVDANPEKLRPVVDRQVFNLEQLREAYEYQFAGNHQGKVGIVIP